MTVCPGCNTPAAHCAMLINAVDAACCEACNHLTEHGRRLASQRDDLIAGGANPADLAVPLAPPCRFHYTNSKFCPSCRDAAMPPATEGDYS